MAQRNLFTALLLVVLILLGVAAVIFSFSQTLDPLAWAADAALVMGGATVGAGLAALFLTGALGGQTIDAGTQRAIRTIIAAELDTRLRDYIRVGAVARLRQAASVAARQAVIEEMKRGDMFAEADLRDAILNTADLAGTDLRGAQLTGAILRDANLTNANLRDANLSRADLRGAYMRGALLAGAVLNDASLNDAQFLTPDQLRDAASLDGATLPDGSQLPRALTFGHETTQDSGWQEAFQAWYRAQLITPEAEAAHSANDEDELRVSFTDD
ncbi:MAG: pentapeptide repeat-containing protein [Anaerolineae bacterium]